MVLGSPGNAMHSVDISKYTTGKLEVLTGEQRATMWGKVLGDCYLWTATFLLQCARGSLNK